MNLNQSDCSTYSCDQYSPTSDGSPSVAIEMVEVAMMASAERVGFGSVYDKQKYAVLAFVGCKDVLVFLPTGKR